jgi:hypothetical protein
LAQAADLVARPLRDWREADAALERFVLEAGPEHDEALIRLFHRWTVAQAIELVDGISFVTYAHRPFPDFADLTRTT